MEAVHGWKTPYSIKQVRQNGGWWYLVKKTQFTVLIVFGRSLSKMYQVILWSYSGIEAQNLRLNDLCYWFFCCSFSHGPQLVSNADSRHSSAHSWTSALKPLAIRTKQKEEGIQRYKSITHLVNCDIGSNLGKVKVYTFSLPQFG